MEEVGMSGEQLLDLLKEEVEKSYGLEVIAYNLEVNNETKHVSGIFWFKDRIGYVKLETELKAE